MSDWKIEVADKAKPEDLRYVVGKLQDFNDAQTPTPFNRRDLRLWIRNEEGTIIAGLIGSVSMHCFVIQILWVDEAHRSKGLGCALLEESEQIAISEGALQAIVETTDFQAPAFYAKQGYSTLFTLENTPIAANTYFLGKKLG